MAAEKTNGRHGRGRSEVNVLPNTDPSSTQGQGEEEKVGKLAQF